MSSFNNVLEKYTKHANEFCENRYSKSRFVKENIKKSVIEWENRNFDYMKSEINEMLERLKEDFNEDEDKDISVYQDMLNDELSGISPEEESNFCSENLHEADCMFGYQCYCFLKVVESDDEPMTFNLVLKQNIKHLSQFIKNRYSKNNNINKEDKEDALEWEENNLDKVTKKIYKVIQESEKDFNDFPQCQGDYEQIFFDKLEELKVPELTFDYLSVKQQHDCELGYLSYCFMRTIEKYKIKII